MNADARRFSQIILKGLICVPSAFIRVHLRLIKDPAARKVRLTKLDLAENDGMQPEQIRELLEQVKAGVSGVDEAFVRLAELPFSDLGDVKIDNHRALRCGFAEVVLCRGKEPRDVARIIEEGLRLSPMMLATRAEKRHIDAIKERFPGSVVNLRGQTVRVGNARVAENARIGDGRDGRNRRHPRRRRSARNVARVRLRRVPLLRRRRRRPASRAGRAAATAPGGGDHLRRGDGGRTPQRHRRTGRLPRYRGADERRIRREFERHCGAAGHVEFVRGGGHGREYRQRLRRVRWRRCSIVADRDWPIVEASERSVEIADANEVAAGTHTDRDVQIARLEKAVEQLVGMTQKPVVVESQGIEINHPNQNEQVARLEKAIAELAALAVKQRDTGDKKDVAKSSEQNEWVFAPREDCRKFDCSFRASR